MTRAGLDEPAVIRAAASALGLTIDEAALGRILRYTATLATWNRRLRLTGDQDPVGVARHHVADSLAVVSVLPAQGPIVDIGSGQGFPGIILGCVRPDLELVLVESRRRRANFLREAIRQVRLERATVYEQRAESIGDELAGRAHVVIARAIRLDTLLALAVPLLAPDGRVIGMRSERGRLEAARIAADSGFRVCDERRYTLPDGSTRALIVFQQEV